jgi:hypothetical protein
VVFVLPFMSYLVRGQPAPTEISGNDLRKEVGWGLPPNLPRASPRDELTRAFYNPLSRRWERLTDQSDPPSPLELFRLTVKERPGSYKEILRTDKLRIPTEQDSFSVHRVPMRITQESLLVRDIASGDNIYNESIPTLG